MRHSTIALLVSLPVLAVLSAALGFTAGKRARLGGECGPRAVRHEDGALHLVCDEAETLVWQGTAAGVLVWCGCGPAQAELPL